jgi:uncharacterized damage-inducible protein DinB
MVNYFKRLFGYDQYTNTMLIDLMISLGITTGKPVDLMAHTLSAQERWLRRCKRLPPTEDPLWPTCPPERLKELNDVNHTNWIAYLDTLQDSDMATIISYKDMRGEPHQDTLQDILAHIINHGTHHRAQIGQQLQFTGVDKLPITDYIFYVRGLK